MTVRKYNTAAAFKQALEQRLRHASESGPDFARRRQLVVFDRFLARLVASLGDAVTLKGGLAVEFRIQRARTTKDVDLRVMGSPDAILDTLKPRDRDITARRFGLDGRHAHTYREIGEIHGVGTERVRQIIARELRRMRWGWRWSRRGPSGWARSCT